VAFRFQLIAYPLLAFVGVSNQMLQTMRLSGRANLVAAARSGLFFIPLALTLPEFFGLLGVELIQAVSDVCAFILTLPIVTLTFRRMEEKA
jgi:Na+-driven multidrug efflux pump